MSAKGQSCPHGPKMRRPAQFCSFSGGSPHLSAIRRQTLAIAVRTPRGGLEHQPTTHLAFWVPWGMSPSAGNARPRPFGVTQAGIGSGTARRPRCGPDLALYTFVQFGMLL
jgi:hypothetical protein